MEPDGVTCDGCPGTLHRFSIPPSIREWDAVSMDVATICDRCLRVAPATDPSDTGDAPAGIDGVHAAVPGGEAGVAMALLLGWLDSLTLNRAGIEVAITHLESAGVDPLLVIERLLDDDAVSPAIDLERRLRQLQQRY